MSGIRDYNVDLYERIIGIDYMVSTIGIYVCGRKRQKKRIMRFLVNFCKKFTFVLYYLI